MSAVVAEHTLSISDFLSTAIGCASLLKSVQAQRAFHGCINSATLGVARGARLCTAEQLLESAGTRQEYAYLSPEQTGRLNRGVDKRSDYYSLGVVLYELAAGSLPFARHDPLELVHCHLAHAPTPPRDLAPAMPSLISELILKLLNKDPEQRYQTIDSLLFDLHRCERMWNDAGIIDDFALGAYDVAPRLQLSTRLLGRQEEIQTLRQAFGRVARGGKELVLISGYSGVGKSSLAQELQRVALAEGGIYLSGKFDQYKGHIPYVTLAEPLREFVRMLLGCSEVELLRWKTSILQAVGNNGWLLVDLIPELEHFLDGQAQLATLGAAEAQNRFFAVFREFVGVLASAEHPLVIFLDDLQWLDAGSLKLLEHVATHASLHHLLLIGSYRANEVDAAHALTKAVDGIVKRGGVVAHIALKPLGGQDIARLAADALDCDAATVAPLADLVHDKTAGNPFFAIQFLSMLYERGLLAFDTEQSAWQWDAARIAELSFTDNVVDLMVARLDRLPRDMQRLLKHLACIGAAAPLNLLAQLIAMPALAVELLLKDEQLAGMLMRIGQEVRFAHDRIQEAAYSTIAAGDRPGMHLRIARMMQSMYSRQHNEQFVFDLVYQLNQGIDAVSEDQERDNIRHLNALAARRAKASVAFASARDYFAQAIALTPAAAWESEYQASVDLYLECAECEFALGNFDQADALLDTILRQAQTNHDRARVILVRVRMYFAAMRGQACLPLGLEALALFGVRFPEDDAALQALAEQGRRELFERLKRQPIAELAELPLATDPDARMVISLLSELLTAAYSTRPALVLPMLIKALNMSLDYGNVEESCVVYSNYGLLLAGSFHDVEAGYAFSEMSMRLNQRFGDDKWRGRVLYIHGYAFHATQHPMHECLPLLEQAFDACRDVGNLGFAVASSDAVIWMALETGMPLDEVMQKGQRFLEFARQNNTFGHNIVIRMLGMLGARLAGEDLGDEEERFRELVEGGGWKYSIGHFHTSQQIRHYLLGDYEQALQAADKVRDMPASLHALASIVTHSFYHALTIAAVYQDADAGRRQALRPVLDRHLAKLEKWASVSPRNYGNRHALVAAELARLDGNFEQALRLYEDAIASARAAGFVHHEALAHELAARCLLQHRITASAAGHLQAARRAYARWGAHGKCQQLDRAHAGVANHGADARANPWGGGALVNEVDLLTVAKASQAVSSEMVLGRLTETLLKIVSETAGADGGLLVLSGPTGFELAAQAATTDGRLVVLLRHAPLQASDLPQSIFHYVVRTLESVVVDDANLPHPYAADPYFGEHRRKSVLCLPLLKQGKLLGVLYLENSLAASVFTPQRLTMLELLASQAVISLENARLYHELEAENSERKRIQDELKCKSAELQEQASFMNTVIENIPVALFVKDARQDFRLTLWNKAAEDIFKIGKERALGKTSHELWPAEVANKIAADDQAIADAGLRTDIPEQGFCTQEAGNLLLHTIKVPLLNGTDGRADYLIGISEDITDRKRYESMIWRQANFDALTGLPNRTRFRDRLLQEIGRCDASGTRLAVLFIDLDRFKEVNDTLGHDYGDRLLIDAARRIQECVGEIDTVARLGGDEFTVILSGLENTGAIEVIAQNMINALVEPFQLGEEQAFISASIGVTVYPDDATEIEELLKHADQALYVAKDSGRNRFGYYTPALQAAALHRMRLTNDLRAAVERQEFQLYFQPIVDAASGRVHKAEALIRWLHPQRGLVSPAEFIPLAEASGLITELGDWMFREAVRWAGRWRAECHPAFQISLNQSPLEFQRQEDRYERWIAHMHDIGLPGSAIVLEITEGLLLDANSSVCQKIARLSEAGIQIALDDFGTGYSSLAYLKKFDIDYLKIDQAFIRNVTTDPSDKALTEAIIIMAHKLGLQVIAEGVETIEQHNLLRDAGCDFNQGYLFSRPVPAKEFDELLKLMSAGGWRK